MEICERDSWYGIPVDHEQLECSDFGVWGIHMVENNNYSRMKDVYYKEPPQEYLGTGTNNLLPSHFNTTNRIGCLSINPIRLPIFALNQDENPKKRRKTHDKRFDTLSSGITIKTEEQEQNKNKNNQSQAYQSQQTTIQQIQNFPMTNFFEPKGVSFTITVYKRSNGNQPWEASNIKPPMLGKMRRISVQFSDIKMRFEVLFQCKDLKPSKHEGRLVVSSNDKGIARNSFTVEDEMSMKTILNPSKSQNRIVYLKPCWRGFGSNRERPIFTVMIAIRMAFTEHPFIVLHSWEVELHSHKMESSVKGKAMDAKGPFEVSGSIPMSILQNLTPTTDSKYSFIHIHPPLATYSSPSDIPPVSSNSSTSNSNSLYSSSTSLPTPSIAPSIPLSASSPAIPVSSIISPPSPIPKALSSPQI